MLLIDAANVIGSRPTGWWRDRPAAARAFVERIRGSVVRGHLTQPVVVVLEGAARRGAAADCVGGVTVVHAVGSGDDALVDLVEESDEPVTLVSADRELRRRAEARGAAVVGPGWLLDRVEE